MYNQGFGYRYSLILPPAPEEWKKGKIGTLTFVHSFFARLVADLVTDLFFVLALTAPGRKDRTMKFKYQFNNETVEIEVTDNWGTILVDFDRQERNNNQTEKRRHCSLNALDQNDNLLPAGGDFSAAFAEKEEIIFFLEQLLPRQRYLLEQVHMHGRPLSEIAAEEGVSVAAVSQALKRAEKAFKKIYKPTV